MFSSLRFVMLRRPFAIEVLSFHQFSSSLVEKFKAYFALGIQSCWLVEPLTPSIHVYTSPEHWRTFGIDDELTLEEYAIQFPVAEVFSAKVKVIRGTGNSNRDAT